MWFLLYSTVDLNVWAWYVWGAKVWFIVLPTLLAYSTSLLILIDQCILVNNMLFAMFFSIQTEFSFGPINNKIIMRINMKRYNRLHRQMIVKYTFIFGAGQTRIIIKWILIHIALITFLYILISNDNIFDRKIVQKFTRTAYFPDDLGLITKTGIENDIKPILLALSPTEKYIQK